MKKYEVIHYWVTSVKMPKVLILMQRYMQIPCINAHRHTDTHALLSSDGSIFFLPFFLLPLP